MGLDGDEEVGSADKVLRKVIIVEAMIAAVLDGRRILGARISKPVSKQISR